MAFCKNCGTEIPEGARFCPACGTVSEEPAEAQQTYYEQPEQAQQTYYAQPESEYSAPVEASPAETGSIFGKGIAAVIMAWFPITSIVAIILGSIARKAFDEIYASGATISAKLRGGAILAKVGKIAGIVMTIFWVFYIIIIATAIG